jgi:hypothetical protein
VPAEQQPSGRVSDDQGLNGVGAGFAGDEPTATGPTRVRAAHPDLGGGQHATCPLVPKWAITSARARSRMPPSTMQPRSPQQWANLPDGPGGVPPGFPKSDHWTLGLLVTGGGGRMVRRGYPAECRRKVLDLVESGRPVADVAKALGEQTI